MDYCSFKGNIAQKPRHDFITLELEQQNSIEHVDPQRPKAKKIVGLQWIARGAP